MLTPHEVIEDYKSKQAQYEEKKAAFDEVNAQRDEKRKELDEQMKLKQDYMERNLRVAQEKARRTSFRRLKFCSAIDCRFVRKIQELSWFSGALICASA